MFSTRRLLRPRLIPIAFLIAVTAIPIIAAHAEQNRTEPENPELSQTRELLIDQTQVIDQYKQDRDNITKTAVDLFIKGCVDQFDNLQAISEWADKHFTRQAAGPRPAIPGRVSAGYWTHNIMGEIPMSFSLYSQPVECALITTQSFEAITHNEMKLLAGRINSAGRFHARYQGNVVNPKTGTVYSIIDLTPIDTDAPNAHAMQILASTNTQQGRKSVFTIGFADKDEDEDEDEYKNKNETDNNDE